MPMDLSEAIEHLRKGELERAAREFEAALIEDPNRAEALHLLGWVSMLKKDAPRAAELFRRAIAVRPGEAQYHASLAAAYRGLLQTDRAGECDHEALRLLRGNAEALFNYGSTFLILGQLRSAVECFRDAVAVAPDLAPAHDSLGRALQLSGETAEAYKHFRLAVELDPQAAEAQSNLGLIMLERGEPEKALEPCQEAIRLRPDFTAGYLNLGNVLQTLARLDEAIVAFRTAINLKPSFAPAHAGLAGALEALGDSAGALESLRETLRHDPRHSGALARLATQMRGDLPGADQAAIEHLLAETGVPPAGRWPMLFGLAQVFDARARFARAAELAGQANSLQQADFRRRGLAYDPRSFTLFVDRILEKFTPSLFERASDWGLQTERPVFVVGMPRSGTTLVEQILASHPRVFGAGELQLARNAFKNLPGATQRRGYPYQCVEYLDRDAVDSLARQHLDALAERNATADRVVDKMPENTLYLGLLAILFPQAKFIHCRRDLRDSALSCWITNFGQVRWACDQHHIASRAVQHRRVMEHWRRVLGVPVLDVDYELLVADPERVSRELLAWCGLEWDAACAVPHKTRRAVFTASATQVRRPIYNSSVGRWKNYAQALAPMFGELEKLV